VTQIIDDGPFVFVGESPVLDLINTVVVVRGKQRDLLQTPEDVAYWWQAAQRHHPDMERVECDPIEYAADLLDMVKAFRDSMRRLFLSIIGNQLPDDAEIGTLNSVLQTGCPALALNADGNFEAIYLPSEDAHTELLLPIALSALSLLTRADLNRLHKCHNNRCILLFYDTTKSGTRQWCSTACLDRERSLHRYEQKKQLTANNE